MAYSSPPCVSIQVDDDSDDVLVRLNCCNGVILLTKDKITEVGKLYEDHRHVVVVPLQILEPPRPNYCEAAQFNCVMMASATPRALLTYKQRQGIRNFDDEVVTPRTGSSPEACCDIRSQVIAFNERFRATVMQWSLMTMRMVISTVYQNFPFVRVTSNLFRLMRGKAAWSMSVTSSIVNS